MIFKKRKRKKKTALERPGVQDPTVCMSLPIKRSSSDDFQVVSAVWEEQGLICTWGPGRVRQHLLTTQDRCREAGISPPPFSFQWFYHPLSIIHTYSTYSIYKDREVRGHAPTAGRRAATSPQKWQIKSLPCYNSITFLKLETSHIFLCYWWQKKKYIRRHQRWDIWGCSDIFLAPPFFWLVCLYETVDWHEYVVAYAEYINT